MARKSANNLKKGNYFIWENEPFMVLTNDHSKSGKHGHAKSRIGCRGLFTKKKKSLTMTADTNVEIPEILKRNGQLVDVDQSAQTASVMDNETYETFEVDFPLDEDDEVNLSKLRKVIEDPDLMGDTQIEFWDVMSRKFITRVIFP
jgi:translation initiation factor 5A